MRQGEAAHATSPHALHLDQTGASLHGIDLKDPHRYARSDLRLIFAMQQAVGVVRDADEDAERHNLRHVSSQDIANAEFLKAGHAITSFLDRLRYAGNGEGGAGHGPAG
jgi:hypothetical protein